MFEAEVTRAEALQTLELYKHALAGTNISSLQEMCVAMDRSGVRLLHTVILTSVHGQLVDLFSFDLSTPV